MSPRPTTSFGSSIAPSGVELVASRLLEWSRAPTRRHGEIVQLTTTRRVAIRQRGTGAGSARSWKGMRALPESRDEYDEYLKTSQRFIFMLPVVLMC